MDDKCQHHGKPGDKMLRFGPGSVLHIFLCKTKSPLLRECYDSIILMLTVSIDVLSTEQPVSKEKVITRFRFHFLSCKKRKNKEDR
jgi:hypothetical protein